MCLGGDGVFSPAVWLEGTVSVCVCVGGMVCLA